MDCSVVTASVVQQSNWRNQWRSAVDDGCEELADGAQRLTFR